MQDILKPLCWIVGRWKSLNAVLYNPGTQSPTEFKGVLSFIDPGKPVLSYTYQSWDPKDTEKGPKYLENGFLHIDGCSVSLLMTNNLGHSTVEEGVVTNNMMILSTSEVGHMKFITGTKILSLHRCYKLNESGQLEVTSMLETYTTPLAEHTKACYNRCLPQEEDDSNTKCK